MSANIHNGSRKDINGRPHIYYDGYWIRYYAPPEEELICIGSDAKDIGQEKIISQEKKNLQMKAKNVLIIGYQNSF